MRFPARSLLALTLGSALACAAADEPQPAFLRVAEITLDPPEKEQQVVSVRMTPGVTRAYTQLRFECIYRQEYDWTDTMGQKQRRVNEPVRFLYERDEVKLTDDLDAYVSFKMPIGIELLRTRFGATAFKADVPVKVPRIRVEARDGEATVWAYEVPTTPGPQTLTDAQRTDLAKPEAPPAPKPRAERAPLGAVDLD